MLSSARRNLSADCCGVPSASMSEKENVDGSDMPEKDNVASRTCVRMSMVGDAEGADDGIGVAAGGRVGTSDGASDGASDDASDGASDGTFDGA
mmetsp:Transcript_34767/g.46108  ORF Transcript_34767/g.46108 Transcript_34767/m.46108 type:complete len:94 (-) Transcript_34767:1073-1354(-)